MAIFNSYVTNYQRVQSPAPDVPRQLSGIPGSKALEDRLKGFFFL